MFPRLRRPRICCTLLPYPTVKHILSGSYLGSTGPRSQQAAILPLQLVSRWLWRALGKPLGELPV